MYSRCKVNRGTNLSVVLCYVISLIASTVHLGFCVAFLTCGVRSHYATVHSVTTSVGNLVVSLAVVVVSWMLGTVLVSVSKIGEDQSLWSGVRLCLRYQ